MWRCEHSIAFWLIATSKYILDFHIEVQHSITHAVNSRVSGGKIVISVTGMARERMFSSRFAVCPFCLRVYLLPITGGIPMHISSPSVTVLSRSMVRVYEMLCYNFCYHSSLHVFYNRMKA